RSRRGISATESAGGRPICCGRPRSKVRNCEKWRRPAGSTRIIRPFRAPQALPRNRPPRRFAPPLLVRGGESGIYCPLGSAGSGGRRARIEAPLLVEEGRDATESRTGCFLLLIEERTRRVAHRGSPPRRGGAGRDRVADGVFFAPHRGENAPGRASRLPSSSRRGGTRQRSRTGWFACANDIPRSNAALRSLRRGACDIWTNALRTSQ